jgi:hypothetical protein
MQWTVFFLSPSGRPPFPFPNVVYRSVRSPPDYDDRMMECLNVVQCFFLIIITITIHVHIHASPGFGLVSYAHRLV